MKYVTSGVSVCLRASGLAGVVKRHVGENQPYPTITDAYCFVDLDAIAGNWGLGTAPGAVPEPTVLALLALGGLLVRRRTKDRPTVF